MENTQTAAKRPKRRGVVLLSVATLALPMSMLKSPHEPALRVLVQASTTELAVDAVEAVDGKVVNPLEVIAGAVAEVPADEIDDLEAQPGVTSVTVDDDASLAAVLAGTTYDTETQAGSMYTTARLVGADTLWAQGYNGTGVGIALIDSGVQANSTYFGTRLLAGADYSGGTNSLTDGFGHGTHLASIIMGSSGTIGAPTAFTGIAPRAKLYSVKVANNTGQTSLTKILQGMDWVYKNRSTKGIKVVNLSLGAAAYDDYRYDPLAAAAERLWNGGVTVVASAGNIGAMHNLVSPAYDPTVIAVGALDTNNTVTPDDDVPASFSAGGYDWSARVPDVLAPGRSIQGLKATGSTLAGVVSAFPSAQIGTAFMKGSGTSQAAAVVSGQVALMLQANPAQTPNDVKGNLYNLSTYPGWGDDRELQGWLKAEYPDWAVVDYLYTGWGAQGYAATAVSGTTADELADNQARNSSWQGSSWQGSSWQGSSWQGSSWQGSLWMGFPG